MTTMALIAKPYSENEVWNDDANDGIEWSNLPAHLTVDTLKELCEKLEESEKDERAGRVIWLDDAVDEILLDIKNGTL